MGLTDWLAWRTESTIDWLQRRCSRSYFRWLLLEDGQGWLCWRYSDRETYPSSYYEPPEPYAVAPPLRRLAMAVRYRALWPFVLRDEERAQHAAW